MSWLASILVALLTAVLGLFLAGFIAAACCVLPAASPQRSDWADCNPHMRKARHRR